MGLLRNIISNLSQKGLGSTFGLVSGGLNTSPKRGTKGMLGAYNQLPWLRAILGKISKSTSTQQWKVFVQVKDGKPIRNMKINSLDFDQRQKFIKKGVHNGELQELENHPITEVLNGGTSFLPGSTNLQVAQIHLDSVGDSFLLKERNNFGVVESLVVIPPHWIVETPSPGGNPVFKMSIGSIQQDILVEDMIWIKDPNPVNPYGRGSGIAMSMIDELETDEFAAKHTKSWFYNSARPDIIVSGDGLDKGSTKRLEEDWNSKNQGFLKRFKPYFMNTNVKVQQLNSSFQDMQLIQLREFERDLFIQIFGIPPEILGIVENSNRATINTADFIFGKHLIVPRLEQQRTVFQRDLVPEYDERLILQYESPLKEDDEFNLEVMKAQPHAFTLDEWRDLAGREELEDGKGRVYAVPFNVIITDTLSSDTSSTPVMIDDEPEKRLEHTEVKRLGKPKALSIDETAFVKRIVNTLKAQIIVDAITPAIANTVNSFGETMTSSIGQASFNTDDPAVTEFITTSSGNRIRSIVDNNTRKKLRKALVDGLEKGESIDDLTDRVNRLFDGATSNRSKAISRTETVRAANFGSQSGMKQTGVPKKEWLSSRDPIVRESHGALDGVVIPMRANFKSPVTGAEGPYPGELGLAEDDINCRCTVVPVFNGEERSFNGMTKDAKEAIWKAFENQRMPFEKRMRIELNKGFEEQRKDILAELNKELQ